MRKVKLRIPVLYRGVSYEAGEPVVADKDTIAIWEGNGFLQADSLQQAKAKAVPVTAPTPPGIVQGGTGAEGVMPGKVPKKKE